MHANLLYSGIGILISLNVAAFAVMAVDKHRSIHNQNSERIPEGIFFFLAAAFGSIGIYAGMFLLRHKTRKWYFALGIPLLIIQNAATLYLCLEVLKAS